MDLKPWPGDFLSKKRGMGCPQCEAGSVAETEHGVRYFEGKHADGYLQRQGPTTGYSVVVFRGRHVGDLQSMTPQEQADFWTDVSMVAQAIEATFGPIHLNFQILGNQDPHIHVHIVPRYDPDPAPSLPLPAEAWAASSVLSPEELKSQVERLRTHLASANRDIPGGFCDPAEHPADAALREVAEETGLADIELIDHLGTWIDTYPDDGANRGERPVQSTLNHYYLARRTTDGPLRPDPAEALKARFFGVDELPNDIAFPDYIRLALTPGLSATRPITKSTHR